MIKRIFVKIKLWFELMFFGSEFRRCKYIEVDVDNMYEN